MQQVIHLPDPNASFALRLSGGKRLARALSDEQYFEFCAANPGFHIERTAEGDIMVSPPAGGESEYRNSEALADLKIWSRKDGRGKAFGPSVQYLLPDGQGLSPDASWVSNESLARLTKAERRAFLRLVPEFVIEVMSPTDRLKEAKAKMERWLANGVQLGWLIDGDRETVHVYRPGKPAEVLRHASRIKGEGPVRGFVLPLEEIWRGL